MEYMLARASPQKTADAILERGLVHAASIALSAAIFCKTCLCFHSFGFSGRAGVGRYETHGYPHRTALLYL